MNLKDALIGEFAHESASTRRVLERIPADRLDWRPHPKSMSFGELATHIVRMVKWGVVTLEKPDFDMDSPEAAAEAQQITSVAEILSTFDANTAALKASLANLDLGTLGDTWTLRKGGMVFFAQPRGGVFRGMILNHTVHHRGQLDLYLRLNEVPLPAIYGPSADEQPAMV